MEGWQLARSSLARTTHHKKFDNYTIICVSVKTQKGRRGTLILSKTKGQARMCGPAMRHSSKRMLRHNQTPHARTASSQHPAPAPCLHQDHTRRRTRFPPRAQPAHSTQHRHTASCSQHPAPAPPAPGTGPAPAVSTGTLSPPRARLTALL